MSMRSPSTRACARRPRHYGDADAGDSSDDAGDRKRRRRAAARRGPSRSGYPSDAGTAAAAKLADLKAYLLRNGAAIPEDFGAWYVEFIPRGDAYFFAADGSRYRSRTEALRALAPGAAAAPAPRAAAPRAAPPPRPAPPPPPSADSYAVDDPPTAAAARARVPTFEPFGRVRFGLDESFSFPRRRV
jgi:hypothetical protein